MSTGLVFPKLSVFGVFLFGVGAKHPDPFLAVFWVLTDTDRIRAEYQHVKIS